MSNDNGKGDTRRPQQISESEMAANWDQVFADREARTDAKLNARRKESHKGIEREIAYLSPEDRAAMRSSSVRLRGKYQAEADKLRGELNDLRRKQEHHANIISVCDSIEASGK